MTKGNLHSAWITQGRGRGTKVHVARIHRTHIWAVADMTDASFYRLRDALDKMTADITFDDDKITVTYYPKQKGTDHGY